MAITLFNLESVVTQLKTSSLIKSVGGAADLASAEVDFKKAPAAYVIPLADDAGENMLLNTNIEQEIKVSFAIVLAVTNKRDPRGEAALVDLKAAREEIFAKIYGWVPANEYTPVTYQGGKLMKLENTFLWWQERFATSYLIRN
jgi:hypothetical protein